MSFSRIRAEFRRDGARLLKKVRSKLLVDEGKGASEDSVGTFARQVGLTAKTLQEIASSRNVPYLEVGDHNDKRALSFLRATAPDVIAFTGGGIIRKDLLSIPHLGTLNCHCGILPQYRGMDVVEWPAVERRLEDIGIGLTLHFMDSGIDTGSILLRRRMELRPDDTFMSIRDRIPPLQVGMYLESIRGLRDGTLRPIEQAIEHGRQYYVMHPRILRSALRSLNDYTKQLKSRDNSASEEFISRCRTDETRTIEAEEPQRSGR